MNRRAIRVAQMELTIDNAVVVVSVPVALVAGWDAHLIRNHDTSVSRVLNAFSRDHPFQFWSYLMGGAFLLGLHVTVTKDDVLHKIGRRLKR